METEHIVETLEAIGHTDVPLPDPHFLSKLESWLMEPHAQVIAIERATAKKSRAPRMIRRTVIGSMVAAASLGGGLVAAKSLVIDRHRSDTIPAVEASTTIATITEITEPTVASTIAGSSTTELPRITIPLPVTTRVDVTTTRQPEVTSRPVPTTLAPPVENTETRPPVNLTIECKAMARDGGAGTVMCRWGASASGELAQYRVLRTTPGATAGRAFLTNDVSITDTSAIVGTAHRYMVQAIRADGTVIETSVYFTVTWPETTTTTTAATTTLPPPVEPTTTTTTRL